MSINPGTESPTHHGWFSQKARDKLGGGTEQTNLAGERKWVTCFGSSSTRTSSAWGDEVYQGEFVKRGGDAVRHTKPLPPVYWGTP